MLIGLKVQRQIPLQRLEDSGGVRQGQTLPQDPRMGFTHLGEGKRNRNQGGKSADKKSFSHVHFHY